MHLFLKSHFFCCFTRTTVNYLVSFPSLRKILSHIGRKIVFKISLLHLLIRELYFLDVASKSNSVVTNGIRDSWFFFRFRFVTVEHHESACSRFATSNYNRSRSGEDSFCARGPFLVGNANTVPGELAYNKIRVWRCKCCTRTFFSSIYPVNIVRVTRQSWEKRTILN